MSDFGKYTIKVGMTFKVNSKLKTGVTTSNLPCWKFPVAMGEKKDNGEFECYEWYWLRSFGRCPFKVGDIVRLTSIEGITSIPIRNNTGGRATYKLVDCLFEKAGNREYE